MKDIFNFFADKLFVGTLFLYTEHFLYKTGNSRKKDQKIQVTYLELSTIALKNITFSW